MNRIITYNQTRLSRWQLLIPLLLLVSISVWLYSQNGLSVEQYPQIQKDCFISLNYAIGQFPSIVNNITQMGDAIVLLAFISLLFVDMPKMWEAVISGLIVSFILTIPKIIFSMPRPAAVFDNDTFIIIGEKLTACNSTPSGHSITIFTLVSILMFYFMPKDRVYNLLWIIFCLLSGLFVALSRVGVGAHYPLDVAIGSAIGYIAGLTGILISQKYKIWAWISIKKYYPIFILLIAACSSTLIYYIFTENLIIFYLALFCTIISLYKICYVYFKK